MEIEREHETRDYTVLPNALLHDPRISWRATGLLVTMLSLRPGEMVTCDNLVDWRTEGREAVRRALRELVAAGYFQRRKWRDERGRWRTKWTVSSRAKPAESAGLDPHCG